MTLNDLQNQVELLKNKNELLNRLNEELRQKVGDLESIKQVLSAREETFGNLPTGLSARSPQPSKL